LIFRRNETPEKRDGNFDERRIGFGKQIVY
jgi:hypothetical protein